MQTIRRLIDFVSHLYLTSSRASVEKKRKIFKKLYASVPIICTANCLSHFCLHERIYLTLKCSTRTSQANKIPIQKIPCSKIALNKRYHNKTTKKKIKGLETEAVNRSKQNTKRRLQSEKRQSFAANISNKIGLA